MEKIVVYRCECGFETENENEANEHEKECKEITIKRIFFNPYSEVKFTTEIFSLYSTQMLNRNFDEVEEQLGRFFSIHYCVETKNLTKEYEDKCKKKMIEYYNMGGTISPYINDEEMI